MPEKPPASTEPGPAVDASSTPVPPVRMSALDNALLQHLWNKRTEARQVAERWRTIYRYLDPKAPPELLTQINEQIQDFGRQAQELEECCTALAAHPEYAHIVDKLVRHIIP